MSKYPQDEKLLERITQGDLQLVEELFFRFRESFINFITDEEIDHNKAQELYSEAFETFYFNIRNGKLEPPLESKLKTYLLAIGKNLRLRIKHSKIKASIESLDSLDNHALGQEESHTTKFEQDANKQLVQDILDQLDPKCRELLTLSFIKGYSDDAIMREKGYSDEGAVRQQRFRCLKKVRKLFNL